MLSAALYQTDAAARRVGKGASRKAGLLAQAVVRLCPRRFTSPLDPVGKVARRQCTIISSDRRTLPTLRGDEGASAYQAGGALPTVSGLGSGSGAGLRLGSVSSHLTMELWSAP